MSFYSKSQIDDEYGFETIILGYKSEQIGQNSMEAWIVPSYGSNFVRWTLGNHKIIDFDKKVLVNRLFTGTPVLYPTPNRVKNGEFIFNGRIYKQIKNGKKIYLHGLVHDEPWEHNKPYIQDDSIRFNTWIDFEKTNKLYEAFPFENRLEMEFQLCKNAVNIYYSVTNTGSEAMPFGFALHPYFMKLSGDNDTYISIPASGLIETTSEILPTGQVIDVKGTKYDLNMPVVIGNIDMDNDFTRLEKSKPSKIHYKTLDINMTLSATEDFSHIVLYTPKGENYFCIENQTCSIDAHNMYNTSLVEESGLIILPPGKVHTGKVSYQIVK